MQLCQRNQAQDTLKIIPLQCIKSSRIQAYCQQRKTNNKGNFLKYTFPLDAVGNSAYTGIPALSMSSIRLKQFSFTFKWWLNKI